METAKDLDAPASGEQEEEAAAEPAVPAGGRLEGVEAAEGTREDRRREMFRNLADMGTGIAADGKVSGGVITGW
jgi:hypothetical protein